MSAAMEPDDNPLLNAAMAYAARGWPVIPLHHIVEGVCTCQARAACKTPGKHPRVADWVKRGTVSGADLWEWWGTWPTANVGILTGAASGVWALDVDPAHGGWDTLTGLLRDYGELPATRLHRTGSGGVHYLWNTCLHTIPSTSGTEGNALGPGIDTRGEGGMIVAPPSISGLGPYSLQTADLDPAPAPDWLIGRMQEILHSRHSPAGPLTVAAAEALADHDIPRKLRLLLGEIKGDGERHQHFWAIVAEARRAGLTPGQTVTAVTPWCEAVDKFRGRVPTEVARAWARLAAEDAAVTVDVPQAPQVPPPPPGPPQGVQDTGNYALVLPFPPQAPTVIPPGWEAPPTPPGMPPPGYVPPPPWTPPQAVMQALAWASPPSITDRIKCLDWSTWDDEETAVDWLWEPFIERGHLVVVYSPAGAGKSLWCQEGAAALAAGWSPPGGKPADPVVVAYVDAENDARTVMGRYKAMGYQPADLDLLRYFVFPDLLPLDSEAGGREFIQLVEDIGAQIVFLDTVGQFFDGPENDAETFRNMYRHTLQPLKAKGIAVVLLDHSGKDLDRKQRGSSSKSGDPDAIWRLTASSGERLKLVREKDRLGRGPCTLEIRRRTSPLRHDVTVVGPTVYDGPDGEVRVDGELDAVALDVIRHLDELGAPLEIHSPAAMALLRKTRMPEGVRRGSLLAALRFRRAVAGAGEAEGEDDE